MHVKCDVWISSIWLHEDALDPDKSLDDGVDVGLDGVWW
jgi:hypothetical protein